MHCKGCWPRPPYLHRVATLDDAEALWERLRFSAGRARQPTAIARTALSVHVLPSDQLHHLLEHKCALLMPPLCSLVEGARDWK